MKHFKVMMACCCCLVFAQAATAQMFTNLSVESKVGLIEEDCGGVPCPPIDCGAALDLDVCNVYANFDGVFPDVKMLSVTMANITATAPFFQNAFGVDTSPPCAFIPVFPDLQCDTFVTMNRKNTCPGDATNTDPSFLFGPASVTGGWFNSDPTNDQGHPQPTADPNVNQVLIAQFAVPTSVPANNVTGMIELSWQAPDGGPVVFSNAMFECVPPVQAPCVEMPELCSACEECVPDDPGPTGCVPLSVSTLCDNDGDLCTGDHCDGQGNCIPFPAGDVICADPNPPCDGGEICDPGTGECLPVGDAPASTMCEADGDLCTNDHCDGMGNCVFLSDVMCQAPNPPCEGGEICDPGSGMCVPQPDAAVSTECNNDGDLCTGEHCDGQGNCVDFPAGDVMCADPIPPCEGGETCNPATGMCDPLPDAAASTDCELDGDLCTGEHCDGMGNCVDFPAGDVMCQDANPPCEGGEMCDPGTGECIPMPDAPLSTDCEADGDLCTIDHCDGAGACVLLDMVICDPPMPPCEGGQECNPSTGMCEDLPDAPMSTVCNTDGDLCTGEHCDGGGSCVDFPAGDVICQDANPPCEGGEICDPGTGECIAQPDAAVSTMCEADGNLCTNDHCDGIGNCVFLSDVMCQDPVPPCEGGAECDPATGMCVDLPDAPMSTDCEADGDLCTIDHCDGAGDCVFLDEVMCPEGSTCDPDTGECVSGEAQTLIIKQGACPAPLNPGSNGVLPTVLVGDFNFDVFDVDLATLQLCRCDGVGGCVAPIDGPPGPAIKYADLNHPFEDAACGTCSCNADQSSDGITDLALKFKVSELAEVLMLDSEPGGSVIALQLNGLLVNGAPVLATDCISIRPPGAALPDSLAVESNIADTFIDVTPLDLLYDEGGYASFVRWYQGGSTVTVTAPVVNHAGLYFAYWVVNGVAQPTGQRTLDISVIGETNIEAVYRPGRLLQPENLPVGFQRPDGSFGNGG